MLHTGAYYTFPSEQKSYVQQRLYAPALSIPIAAPSRTQRQDSLGKLVVLKGHPWASRHVSMVKVNVDTFTALPLQITQVRGLSDHLLPPLCLKDRQPISIHSVLLVLGMGKS